jgi:hypothetical protein
VFPQFPKVALRNVCGIVIKEHADADVLESHDAYSGFGVVLAL